MKELTRVAIVYNFNDHDWFGGRNYFGSLFSAICSLKNTNIRLVLIIGKKTITDITDEFNFIEIHKTSALDRFHPIWFLRQITIKFFSSDPILIYILNKKKIDILSHADFIGKSRKFKIVSWLKDFQFMHLPNYWNPYVLRWTRRWYKLSSLKSDAIIVSSLDAHQDLKKFIPDCRLPIYELPFVSRPFNPSIVMPVQELMRKYNIPEKYIYLPNQFWKSKNHAIAINALEKLRNEGYSLTIVCTGKTEDPRSRDHFKNLQTSVAIKNLSNHFIVLGIVPYLDTVSLMYHSMAVLNPSLFEGWSTTVEEGKTQMKPLLLSDINIHREQAHDAIFFSVKDDGTSLCEALIGFLTLSSLNKKEQRLNTYNERQKEFAEKYLSIINDLLSKN